jgi:hypothetical protein
MANPACPKSLDLGQITAIMAHIIPFVEAPHGYQDARKDFAW